MNSKTQRIPARGLTPEAVARALPPTEPLMLWATAPKYVLPSGESSHFPANNTVMVLKPRSVITLQNDVLSISKRDRPTLSFEIREGDNPFAIIREHFDFLRYPSAPEGNVFSGGLMGFVGYDTARYFEQIQGTRAHAQEPDIFLFESPLALTFDRERDEIELRWLPAYCSEEEVEEMKTLCLNLEADFQGAERENPQFQARFDRNSFVKIVERAKEYICAGDIFQVVLANTFFSTCEVDALRVFSDLRLSNPSPYHYLLRFNGSTIVGASPEVMLRGQKPAANAALEVSMRLVAGTYPKEVPGTPEEAASKLGEDRKELAEHLMLVDHSRNDIGKVSEIGKVRVTDLFSVETYSNVHHLVSQVSGVIAEKFDVLDALEACFPISTLTGTPKIRAMEIIAELEGASRGIFGGAIVQFGYDGRIDSTVAIRALVTGPGYTKIQAGAGIVFDSNPEREYEECLWKARSLFEALKK